MERHRQQKRTDPESSSNNNDDDHDDDHDDDDSSTSDDKFTTLPAQKKLKRVHIISSSPPFFPLRPYKGGVGRWGRKGEGVIKGRTGLFSVETIREKKLSMQGKTPER